jgi:hypothetical protein
MSEFDKSAPSVRRQGQVLKGCSYNNNHDTDDTTSVLLGRVLGRVMGMSRTAAT